MPRGEATPVGTENVAQNGYTYVKTPQGWRLKHHIVAEEVLGRPLKSNERVYLIDKNKQNLNPDNIQVETSKRRKNKLTLLQLQLNKIQDQLNELMEEEDE